MTLVLLGYVVAWAQTETAMEVSVPELVKRLADPQFLVRTAATEDLIAAEAIAIPPVADALRTSRDIDVQMRCTEILAALAQSRDPEIATAASSAIDTVAGDPRATGFRRARQLQGQILRARRIEAIVHLRERGAILMNRDHLQLRWGNRAWGNPLAPEADQTVFPPIDEPIGRLVLQEDWQGDVHDLAMLLRIPEITDVVLDHPQVGAAELNAIAQLPDVTHLILRGIKIGDEDLTVLRNLPQLATLSILYIPITDASISELETWKKLQWLSLVGTNTTEERVAAMRVNRAENLIVEHKSGAFLGITPGSLNEVPPDQGLHLITVSPGGAAERAGLHQGDYLLRFDGEPVKSFDELKIRIGAKNAGDTVELIVRRGDEELTKKVLLGKWSSADWWAANGPFRLNPMPANVIPNPAPILPPGEPPRRNP